MQSTGPMTENRGSPGLIPDRSLLLDLYEQMVLLRRFELAAQRLYREGRIPGFIHLYVGEEAVAAGVCAHLRHTDWITSTHRGHGHALAKGVPARVVLAELYGKSTGCCGGRGGSMHLYDRRCGLFGTNGFVGGGIPASVGIGFSARVRRADEVSVAFFGDGAVNHGAFHESVNLAAAQNLPVIFVCENNLYATATPLALATRNTDIASRAAAYGIPGVPVDGNDVLAVWRGMGEAVQRARSGHGPTLLEARTYRTVGHHEGDPLVGTYRTQEELDQWKARCPIRRFEQWLLSTGGVAPEALRERESAVDQTVREAVEFAEQSPLPDPATALEHVWAEPLHPALPVSDGAPLVEQTWLEAVRDGIAEEMRRDPHILYLGEGIGERGGTFAHTKNLWQEFGPARVIDTPICELAFTGAAVGASATGARAIADLMFADFLFEAASQIIQQGAKLRYMTRGQIQVPMVVRCGMGSVKNAGPHHSGAYYPVWAHCPGLLVAVPSTPADARGLFQTALRSGDPVLMLEHKMLFSTRGPVPAGTHLVPFGQAVVRRTGTDLTLVACGLMVHRCLEAASLLEAEGISAEVIDLRTLVPLDTTTVLQSLAKTGRLLVVDEAFSMCGIGAEISAVAMEEGFDDLDAPVGRLHTAAVAMPFSPPLEGAVVVATGKIVETARSVVEGRAPAQRRPRNASRAAHPDAAPGAVAKPPDASIGRLETPAQGVPVRFPNQDLTVTEAVILRCFKTAGDRVAEKEPLVEVETAKSVFSIEAPVSGQLLSLLVRPGECVPLTSVLGYIQPDGGAA